MKKLLFLILVLALTLGTLASCDLLDKIPFLPDSGDNSGDNGDEGGEGNGGDETVETDIQEAVKELEDQYSDDNGTSTANDYELIAQMKINGTVFTVNWTTDNDSVKLELVDGLWCVDVPEDISENTTYTLTATITTEGGQNAEVEFTRVLVASFGKISNPEVGKAYKFALLHGNEKAVVYFDGNNYNNYAWYLSYTPDQLAAVDVYLEAVEGVEDAYRLFYNKDGEKTYIVAFPRDGDTTKGTLKLDTVCPEEYYTWDADYDTLVYTSVTGESFYIGSSGTYKSISLSAYSYITGATSYVAHLYGAGGEKEELPEQVLPEVPENYTSADLIDALYKLESGQTLEGPYELTGIITSIKYAYDPAYNNVSVNIIVAGREDKPVLAYRLNGGEELQVGDTITIFAGLTNYNGTYETTSGGVIREVVPGNGTVPEQPEAPSDAKGILDALYALADGASLEGSFTLTGKITALDSYKNPTIVVEGFENQPVYCYRLSVTNAIGDVITVTATTMKNYGGTYEFMNCTLVENGGDTPSNPGDNDETPAASIDMMGSTNIQSHSNEQMIYSANGIILTNDKNTSSTNCYNNTGSYAARFYTGATIKIEYTGMTKIVLTLDDYSPEAGKDYLKGFDGMTVEGATIVRENDVVTIYFAAATDVFQSAALSAQVRVEKIDIYTGEVETPEVPEQPETPTYTNPVAGQAYDLFMELPSGKVYFAGSMSGDYLATTTDAAASVKIYFEEVNGGYHIYFMNGDVKTYITAAAYLKDSGYAGCHFYLTTDTPTLAWTYNTQYGIIEIYDEIEGKSDTFFAGTYGSYNTVSLSGAYYKDQIASGTQYPARISLADGGNTDTPVDPDPEQPVEPETPAFGVVDPVVGTAYKFGMVQGNLENAIYYLAGGMAQTYYLATTDDVSAAIDVYIEEAEGGYYLYTLDGETKLYINMVVSGTHVNGAYESAPSTVYTYDAENKTLIASVTPEGAEAPADYWFGTRNDKTYTTVGPCAVSYAGFYCQFYGATEGGNTDTPVDPDPEQPVEPETPAVPEDGVYTIPEALAAAVGTNVIVKGQVVEINQVWSEQFGNITVTIADEDGNELYVYRMTTNVVAGDFVTITGTVGEYNGAKQIAQGATAEITGHEDLVVDASCKTVSFADVANRTAFSDDKQVWEANGVIVTNNKAASTQKIGDYSAPVRFYANTDLTIECAGMTKITFNLNSGKPAANFTDSISGMTGFTVETDGNDITLIFDSAVDSFSIACFVAQVRVDSIDVYVG